MIESLVYIPSTQPETTDHWVDLHTCVWDGPKCLRRTYRVSDFYPEHRWFFLDTLGLESFSWDTLLKEAQLIEASDDLKYISEIFIAIDEYLQKNNGRDKLAHGGYKESLTRPHIFPIKTGLSEATFDYLGTAQEDEIWFIADRPHLWKSFKGLIPLLALDVDSVGKITTLIQILGLERRLLSRVAYAVPNVRGPAKLRRRYTSSLRMKSRSIARLVIRLF